MPPHRLVLEDGPRKRGMVHQRAANGNGTTTGTSSVSSSFSLPSPSTTITTGSTTTEALTTSVSSSTTPSGNSVVALTKSETATSTPPSARPSSPSSSFSTATTTIATKPLVITKTSSTQKPSNPLTSSPSTKAAPPTTTSSSIRSSTSQTTTPNTSTSIVVDTSPTTTKELVVNTSKTTVAAPISSTTPFTPTSSTSEGNLGPSSPTETSTTTPTFSDTNVGTPTTSLANLLPTSTTSETNLKGAADSSTASSTGTDSLSQASSLLTTDGSPTASSTAASDTSSPTVVTIPSAPNVAAAKSSDHAGAIAGGTIGGIAFLAILGFLLWRYLRRQRLRRLWGNLDGPTTEKKQMQKPAWATRFFHRYSDSNESVSSHHRDFSTSPFTDDHDISVNGHSTMQIPHLPSFPPLMATKATREPVFSIVGLPGSGAAGATTRAVASGQVGFGNRHSDLISTDTDLERGIPQTETSPISPAFNTDPDPFRSTPVQIVSRTAGSSTDGHGRASSDHSHSETSHAATLPFPVALPHAGVPIMRPMQPVMPDVHPPPPLWLTPVDIPPMARAPLPPIPSLISLPETQTQPQPPQLPRSEVEPFMSAYDHRTYAANQNPFSDSHSVSRSFDSTGKSSFLSSGVSVYSDDDSESGTVDGIPRAADHDYWRTKQVHTSDLFVHQSEEERNSRALSSSGLAL